MVQHEPTTEEIVRSFRGAHIFGITQASENRIADRLEQQARDINVLTDRAECAEKERDALINSIERLRTKKIELCSICEFEDLIACCHKDHCDGYRLFKWRGLPQEGEGK